MIGHTKLLSACAQLVKRSKADATSVAAEASVRRVLRFAYETIHQDIRQESLSIWIKVINNKRVGVAVTDRLDKAGLARGLDAAMEIAKHAPALSVVAPLPRRTRIVQTADYVKHTAAVPTARFPDELKRLFQACQGVGAQLAGSIAVGEDELAVANSAGVACYHASTISGAKCVTMYRTLSGFASGVHRDADQLDLEALLQRSLAQSLHRTERVALPTGDYEVVLEPEAVAELMMWLGFIAFGAKSFQEKTSFLTGRLGEQVMGRSVTIADDATHPDGLRMPFDFEGVPKQRVALVDRGKAAGIVYDSQYGQLYGHPSTGHAMPPNDVEGPIPTHLVMEPGTKRREELIRSCRRGILVPRFHYVNGLLNPREALMTGLTREGAFLIENGKVKAPIMTMRFTQSLLEAFNHVLGISKERELIGDPATDESGSALMPAVHLAKFRFTGRTQS